MHIEYWWESPKERDHQEHPDVDERAILKWILERKDSVVWTGSIWLGIWTSGEHF
jgi:hypothetical protein